MGAFSPVSYTHLDVYKRQLHLLSGFVPLAPFIAERRVAQEVHGILARVY